tara:strand:+ start:70 stop:684 length:615 start_codon:yes stop_codon:yes gene_type:complete
MKFHLLVGLILIVGCSYSKQTFICGDRECVNKKEANDYFKKNLSIQVKVKKSKTVESFDLVYLNTNSEIKKNVKDTNPIIKILSNKKKKTTTKNIKNQIKIEDKLKKKKIKDEKKIAKLVEKKRINKINQNKKVKEVNANKKIKKNFLVDKIVRIKDKKKNFNTKKIINLKDACPIIENCDIDKITKILLIKGREMGYPDITSK